MTWWEGRRGRDFNGYGVSFQVMEISWDYLMVIGEPSSEYSKNQSIVSLQRMDFIVYELNLRKAVV